jgi:ubiquitin C-terminal hydrolase
MFYLDQNQTTDEDVVCFILFKESLLYSIQLGYPGGLINYGNNCFANAIVQCLAASSIFIRWIEEHLQNNTVAKILLDLIKSINGQSLSYSQESTVATLIDHMRQPRWLSPFEQQDSHEFLLSLINSLTNKPTIQPKQLGFAACLDSDEQDVSTSMMITESPLITPHPFQALQATQLQCTECKHKVNNSELLPMDYIPFSFS